jgi:hypothetical protein
MQADNLHLLARPGGATASAGGATVPGVAVLPFSIAPGQEQVLSFPHGVIGGPLTLTLFQGNQLLASQRVQYYHSFNEVPAQPATAAATSWQFAWFDHKSSPGFQADNLHLLNPAGSLSPAQVTLSIPGCSPTVSSFGSSELIYSCPFGSGFGGPVTISASVPVLASQRVQYYQSFNEEWAQNAAAAATSLQFSWYDHKSSPGFQADNLHVWNPAGTPFTATAQIPGCPSQSQSSTGSELLFSCTGGFSGPVTLTASLPVLASQRVQYYQSFNEVPAASAAQAATTLYQAWFDRISDPGFQADNLHVWNPAGAAFSVSVLIPGCASQNQDVAAGAEAVVTCAAGFGGPVVISSASPLLASQRVQYYQSFNEIGAES